MTPSFNQGEFIEAAIRSVLLQGYPRLELLIIDGGSRDHTVRVLERYSPWLTCWTSEPDGGQSEAINKGMAKTGGEVLGWLCADDLLLPGALLTVGRYFAAQPDCCWLAGACDLRDATGVPLRTLTAGLDAPDSLVRFWRYGFRGSRLAQPSTFWRRELWERVGGVRVDNHLAMDYELWLAFEERVRLHTTPERLSVSVLHPGCKTRSRRLEQWTETMRCARVAARRRGLHEVWLTRRWIWFLLRLGLRRVVGAARAGRLALAGRELRAVGRTVLGCRHEAGRLEALVRLHES